MFKYFFAFFTFSFLLGCLGCQNSEPTGLPELVPFEVLVLQDDKPLKGAHVVFKGEKQRHFTDGLTDGSGIAKMKTQGKYAGIPRDKYKVIVTKNIETPSKYESENSPSDDVELKAWEKKLASEYRPTHSYVEAKYGDEKTSGLSVLVSEKGKVEFKVGKAVDIISIPHGTASKP